jgi:hypothetical protein
MRSDDRPALYSLGAMTKKESGEQPPESATEEVAASLVEHFRSLSMSLTDIPLQEGDPQPGGIRPGKDTGHTPSSGSDETPSSGTESSSAPDPE